MVLSISKTRLPLFDFPQHQVWNFDNILEEVYAIDRHEKPIEYISLANNAYTGATLTRNCVGIWDLQNGRLQKMLANSAHRSVSNVTRIIAGKHHLLTSQHVQFLHDVNYFIHVHPRSHPIETIMM